jgi:hypothetical protein
MWTKVTIMSMKSYRSDNFTNVTKVIAEIHEENHQLRNETSPERTGFQRAAQNQAIHRPQKQQNFRYAQNLAV